MTFHIRTMTTDDIPQVYAMSQALNWPHRREDWAIGIQLGEGVVIEEQGEVIGSAILWRWGDEAATIGLVIVANQHQGRGLGKQLMLALLEKVPGYNVRLHATEMGKGLYEKLGFVTCGKIMQYQTPSLNSVPTVQIPTGLTLSTATQDDQDRLVQMDQAAHGLYRPELIAHLIDDNQTVMLQDDAQQARGFASLRRFGRGWVIGPIIADSFPVAQALTAALMQGLKGEYLRMDTDAALPMAAWFESLGLSNVDSPVTMVRGDVWMPQGMQAFGLMTQAMA
ncbi:histone acetyltransferase [Pantoea ananatis]|uniref:GNAT family N-acetyltransferase n=1 Tax=Pantoea ananas TaxID=553 RepID=UPI00073727E0|nr:GNAT family N-acetyltransferase [Pantoea ananatis]KTR50477.1 histone acetyltransferase [Pantoea ananatis]KTR56815.1 histone acetyltransferase [Pantoea ananatis]KTR62316.1 histone acetyltransferase [Pantoea ananatis]KTR72657.1 histone acetyltransferase [Pantoea ananatis]MBN6030138.1 GNAT family N-acetyltransferase [Pantoea ananatis]